MIIFNFIISLFNSEVSGDTTINTQVYAYNSEKRFNPDKDPHYWLAQVYISRNKNQFSAEEQKNDMQMVAYASTFLHSCIPEPDNARALGLYFIYKERPDIIAKYAKFGAEYNKLLGGIISMQESSPDEFMKLYTKINPITSKSNE